MKFRGSYEPTFHQYFLLRILFLQIVTWLPLSLDIGSNVTSSKKSPLATDS